MASLKKRGRKCLIQFYWRGKQRTKSLGVTTPANAQRCKADVESALDAIRHGRIPSASRLLEDGVDILDIVFPNEKTAHLLKVNGSDDGKRNGVRPGNSPAVRDLVTTCVGHLKSNESDGHWRRVKSRLSHFVNFAGGMSVARLDGDSLDEFLAGRKSDGVRDETRKNEMASIRAMLNWAVEKGRIESTPITKFPIVKTDDGDPFLFKADIDRMIADGSCSSEEIDRLGKRMVLAPEDVERLITLARSKDDRLVAPIRLVSATGIRRGEMAGLRRADFDPNLGRITVHSGKGSRSKKQTVRLVDVHARVLPAMRDHFAALPEGSAWLFPVLEPTTKRISERPHMVCRADRAGRLMRELLVGTEFELLGGWHALRHSFITICVWQGLTFEQISQWTGHIERET